MLQTSFGSAYGGPLSPEIAPDSSYHKDAAVWAWFKSNRHWLEVHQLPPYSPELNPTERLWQHTPKNGTHNRFFGALDPVLATLTRVFGEMQSPPPTEHIMFMTQ
jgi:DDE superfamily endonuclease